MYGIETISEVIPGRVGKAMKGFSVSSSYRENTILIRGQLNNRWNSAPTQLVDAVMRIKSVPVGSSCLRVWVDLANEFQREKSKG